jgi:hypothetical protein
MTKADICRAISEKLEPMSELGNPRKYVNVLDEPGRLSPKGFWRAYMFYSDDDVPTWYPLNYLESEDASARLFRAMPEPSEWLESGRPEPDIWGCQADMSAPDTVGFNENLLVARIVATMKWLGIEGEIE